LEKYWVAESSIYDCDAFGAVNHISGFTYSYLLKSSEVKRSALALLVVFPVTGAYQVATHIGRGVSGGVYENCGATPGFLLSVPLLDVPTVNVDEPVAWCPQLAWLADVHTGIPLIRKLGVPFSITALLCSFLP
jgi:hypothetical protein